MKKLIIGAALALSVIASAQAAHPMCGETDLAENMGKMKDAMKGYKKAMKAGDEAAMAGIVADLTSAIESAKDQVPLAISDKSELDDKQKADFEKYQKGMMLLAEAVKQLGQAEDDMTRKVALKAIGKASKKGHKAFKMDCDD